MKNFYKEYFRIAKGEKIRDKVIFTRMISSVVVTLFCLAGISLTAYAYFYHNISSGLNIMSSAHFEVDVSISAIIPAQSEGASESTENTESTENNGTPEATNIDSVESGEGAGLLEGESEKNTESEIMVLSEGESQTPAESEEQSEAESGENLEENQGAPTEQTSEESLTQSSEEESSENTLPPEAYAPQVEHNQNTYTVKYLYPGVDYKITISHGGSAKTGYCLVRAAGCDTTYVTRQIGADNPLLFSITVNSVTSIEIVPNWGTAALYDKYVKGIQNDSYILDGDTVNILLPVTEEISSETQESDNAKTDENAGAEIIHTVSDGDSIYLISETYSVSMDRITAYNELSDPNVIHTGDIIKIPPADWVMPEITNEQITDSQPEEAPADSTAGEDKTEDNLDAGVTDEGEADEGEAEDNSDTGATDEGKTGEGEAEDNLDAGVTDEGEADEGEAEDNLDADATDEGKTGEGEAEDNLDAGATDKAEADEGEAEDNLDTVVNDDITAGKDITEDNFETDANDESEAGVSEAEDNSDTSVTDDNTTTESEDGEDETEKEPESSQAE